MPLSTIFLDRDGVINRRLPDEYVTTWAEFEFLPGAQEALRLLTEAGLRLIIITNQRGIARGLMSETDLHDIHARMLAELAQVGALIAGIYHCPHDKNQCACRKPAPGLLFQAQRDFPDLDFAASVLIGDSLSDMQAGRRAGCRTFLIRNEAEAESDETLALATDGTARSLYEAALFYLNDQPLQE
jgi:D-glycero-D-manno-heptose 1,7-bisphosphate phosphatase